MKPSVLFFACFTLAASATQNLIDSATIYVQSIDLASTASPLAEIKYNPSTLQAEIVSFSGPELSTDAKLLRIGIYDVTTSSWRSSTSVTSTESFSKGFAPTLVLSLDAHGGIIGISCKSAKIDAGQTRDFGPKVKLLKTERGKLPVLNTPVVLSPEGKMEEPEPEKSLFQKYVGCWLKSASYLANGPQILVGGLRPSHVDDDCRRW